MRARRLHLLVLEIFLRCGHVREFTLKIFVLLGNICELALQIFLLFCQTRELSLEMVLLSRHLTLDSFLLRRDCVKLTL